MCPPDGTGRSAAPESKRVAVLDEYPLWVDALAAALDQDGHFSVDVKAHSGAELLDGLSSHPCEVIVAEPWLRSGDGLAALQQVSATSPDLTIVALSRVWTDDHVRQVMDLGARAYLPKSTPPAILPDLIRGAMGGMTTFPVAPDALDGASALTPRELEVLAMAADGHDNRAIATGLFISERTVKFHLQNAYRKLGARNRTEASAIARKRGMVP